MLFNLFILFCLLIALAGLGAVVLGGMRCLLLGSRAKDPVALEINIWLRFCICLCVGQGFYTLALWIAGYFGLFVILAWLGVFIGVGYVAYLSILCLRDKKYHFNIKRLLSKQASHWKKTSAWLLVLGISLWLGSQYATISLAGPIEGVPGMGNWAYKTKIIYLNQGISSSYFSDYATHYGKFSYPVGFPLLNAAYCTLVGGMDEALIKLHSVVLLSLTYAILAGCFLQRWRLLGIVPMIGILPLFLNEACLQLMRSFYSEPLLLFCAVVAMVATDLNHINHINSFRNTVALLCAGCTAWVKQEGILFFALLSLFFLILCWKDRPALATFKKIFIPWLKATALASCMFVLPWKLYTLCHSVDDSDFKFRTTSIVETSADILTNKNMKTKAAASKVYELGIEQGHHYAGLFWMAPCLLLAAYFTKNRAIWVFPSIGIIMVTIYVGIMAWSQHDMEWHLSATHRYLMLPALCTAASLTFLPTFKTTSTQPKKIV